MHHRPKLNFYLLQLLLLLPLLHGIPAINQPSPQHNNFESNLDKISLHSPQLEETIDEVQKILALDPSLPRLTRGEIEELYEKVTREEYRKSMEAGDLGRAKNMRALMLVLPYNTDNNTEGNLQELYTRPPITKVIDSYSPPQPVKFATTDPNVPPKFGNVPVGNLAATTYKPSSPIRLAEPSPTTYHPTSPQQSIPQDEFMPFLPAEPSIQLRPVTQLPLVYEYGGSEGLSPEPVAKPVHRFSSHYNAKNAEFLKLATQKSNKPVTVSTVRPVADILEGLGIVAQPYNPFNRRQSEAYDYHGAESAHRPVTVANLAPKIGPEAYANFKPLNIGEEVRVKPEVEDYLTRFGIVAGRKRKELEKIKEPQVESSEIKVTKLSPGPTKKSKKSVTVGSLELSKLLNNLQELERLNIHQKNLKTPAPLQKVTSSIAVFSQTTPLPITTRQTVATDVVPLMTEPKKPRRRIDPNLDINFGSTNNQENQKGGTDEVQKLLANLQELEKLRGRPLTDAVPSATTTTAAQIASTDLLKTLGLNNRLSGLGIQLQPLQKQQPLKPPTIQQHVVKKSPQQTEFEQLQRVLKQIEALEQLRNAAMSPTATTAKLPTLNNYNNNDLNQLRKLLNNNIALERLYEQARGNSFATAAVSPPTTSTTTTIITPTKTTRKPPTLNLRDFQELQKYFIQLERARTRTSTFSTTTPTTTTTTTTTTPRPTPLPTIFQMPLISTQDLAQRIAANLAKSRVQNLENEQLQELLKRVQQLETQNNQRISSSAAVPTPTFAPVSPVTGFISRNINQPFTVATPNNYHVPPNDFAQLQQLYHRMQDTERKILGRMEVSTVSTVAKPSPLDLKRTQEFAQRLIDITNDTGYDDFNLRDVAPNDYVQLRKLLSKIKELERVKINGNHGIIASQNARPRIQASATVAPQLLTAASIRTQSVQNMNGAEVPLDNYQREDEEEELQLQQPNLHQELASTDIKTTTEATVNAIIPSQSTTKPLKVGNSPSFSETWGDLEKPSKLYFDSGSEKQLRTDNMDKSYLDMKPPLIEKTLAKDPPAPSGEIKSSHEEVELKHPVYQPDFDKLGYTNASPNHTIDLPKKIPKQLPREISVQLRPERLNKSNVQKSLEPMLPSAETTTTATNLTNSTLVSALSPEVQQGSNTSNHIENSTDSSEKNSSQKTFEDRSELRTVAAKNISMSKENITNELPPTQNTAVFSLTTPKSLFPKEIRTTSAPTESTVQVPIFSATKIIEAAIRRAANKIGVSTEQSPSPTEEEALQEKRRIGKEKDLGIDAIEQLFAGIQANESDDLKGQASELNYQLALPEDSVRRLDTSLANTEPISISLQNTSKFSSEEKPTEEYLRDLAELQRFIINLQELQRLNLSSSTDLLRKADAKYLESFQNDKDPNNTSITKDTPKTRRQSESEMAVPMSPPVTTQSPLPPLQSLSQSESPSPSQLPSLPLSPSQPPLPSQSKSPSTTDTSQSDTDSPTRIYLGLKLGNASSMDEDKPDLDIDSEGNTTTTTPISITTEESRNGPLADLEDSFGPDPNMQQTEPEPPKKKNGFYFLADWNSFLEVGQGDDQVVVRFNPRIGDPRLFIPVSVP